MSDQAYDDKNKEDYDQITLLLNDALNKIASNPKLPATQAQVSELTGIHRNTVRNREFPAKRLADIKKLRKEKAAEKTKLKADKISELTETIDQLSAELVYWFTEYKKANRDREDYERQVKISKESATFYKSAYGKEKDKVRDLEAKNELLKELMRDSK